LASAGLDVVARTYPGRREVRRNDVTHRLLVTLAAMVGLTPPPHGAWTGNDGKPIYFDSIDNSAYVLGQAKHSARRSWVYIDGESFMGARVDVAGDPDNPDLNVAWKYLWTAKDTWLGAEQNLGAIGAAVRLPVSLAGIDGAFSACPV
jgi:hypothetical protein